MRYLFYVNTPAHAHLYKHVVTELQAAGHEVLVLAREYTCTLDILEWYDLPHEVYGYCGTSTMSLVSRLPAHYARGLRYARRFDPDVVVGMGCYAAHTAAVVRSPLVLLLDSEPSSFDHAISTPFARVVLTPAAFRKNLGESHYVFSGFKECAYLHPAVYEPNPSVREQVSIGPDEPFAVIRLNAFGSSHDVGEGGFTKQQRRRLIEALAAEVTVLVSDEGGSTELDGLPARAVDMHPALMHDLLAEASLLVADTQTMVTEAALLGTPAIRSNSFVGDEDMGNFLALEDHGLIYNLEELDAVITRATALLRDSDTSDTWERRRDAFFTGVPNLTDVLLEVVLAQGRVAGIEALQPASEATPQRVAQPSAKPPT